MLSWDAATKTVTANKDSDSNTIQLTLGSDIAFMNGEQIKLSAAPVSVNGSTLVPLRFVSEALGAAIEWDNETFTAVINSDPNNIIPIEFPPVKPVTPGKPETYIYETQPVDAPDQVIIPGSIRPPHTTASFQIEEIEQYFPGFKYFKQIMIGTKDNHNIISVEQAMIYDIVNASLATAYQPKVHGAMHVDFSKSDVRYAYSFYDKDRKWIGTIDFQSISDNKTGLVAHIFGPDSKEGSSAVAKAPSIMFSKKMHLIFLQAYLN